METTMGKVLVTATIENLEDAIRRQARTLARLTRCVGSK